jgi:CheY-like chemotaxis protein
MIGVLLVDDHPIVLSGLAALVQSDDGLRVLATARSVAEAAAVSATPDVALVDLDLPDGDGISLGVDLEARWPTVRVVVLTMHADDRAVLRSLGAGLDGRRSATESQTSSASSAPPRGRTRSSSPGRPASAPAADPCRSLAARRTQRSVPPRGQGLPLPRRHPR